MLKFEQKLDIVVFGQRLMLFQDYEQHQNRCHKLLFGNNVTKIAEGSQVLHMDPPMIHSSPTRKERVFPMTPIGTMIGR